MLLSVSLDVGIKSPFQRRKPKNAILLKKQVKFTDDLETGQNSQPIAAPKDPKVSLDNNPPQGLYMEI